MKMILPTVHKYAQNKANNVSFIEKGIPKKKAKTQVAIVNLVIRFVVIIILYFRGNTTLIYLSIVRKYMAK